MIREIHKIDATDKSLGRLASQIAVLLRGKHKVAFQTNLDLGDIVEVSNCSKIKITGTKLEQEKVRTHSGHPGNLREIVLKQAFAADPGKILTKCVYRMLPTNKLRAKMLKRLRIVK
jgi:large subunit ribosomal protein L13